MADRPPNILFFLPDQHRGDWIGAHADLPLHTPTLDRLCAGGVRFTRALTPSPLCAPARACLASGRDYRRCGVADNGQPFPLDHPTYYRALREAGYSVAGVGKFDLDKPTLDWNLDGSRLIREWGFTEGIDNEGKLDGSISYRRNGKPMGPYLKHLEDLGLADAYCGEHENRRQHLGAYTTAVPKESYCDNWLAGNGMRFLETFPADRPWHLVVNFTGPHSPFDVTPPMRQRWADVAFPPPHHCDIDDAEGLQRVRQNYAAMIENIDALCGQMLDIVQRRGELDNTLVVFSSDHGEMLGDHGRFGKSTWHQPSVGIPMVLAGPGVRQGALSEALVSLTDLNATILDWAGCEALPGSASRSLRPVLEDPAASHRDHVTSALSDWRAVYDGRWKLLTRNGRAEGLYDLAADPEEGTNVLAEHPDQADRLAAMDSA